MTLGNTDQDVVALDFSKAFDSLERLSIMDTLNSFNFDTGIKQWISTFYPNLYHIYLNKCRGTYFIFCVSGVALI